MSPRACTRSCSTTERPSYQYEKRYVRKDGEVIWVRVTVWSDASAAESSQVAIAMIEDITADQARRPRAPEKANRLERIIATQRDISAAASGDLEHVMQVIVERAQALTRAEGAMIHLIEGDDVDHAGRVRDRPALPRQPPAAEPERLALRHRGARAAADRARRGRRPPQPEDPRA